MQNELANCREDGTGEWLFQSTDFKEWKTRPGSVYWIQAKRTLGVLSSEQFTYL